MKRISVIGTVHQENGLANISGLLAILERIAPEVIFLECPPADFDSYLKGAHATVEPNAVNRYRENHRVDLIPVDLPTDENFFTNDARLHRAIVRKSPEYCHLLDWDGQYMRAYGFAYLNSEHCSTLGCRIHDATLAAIEKLADRQTLAELYELRIRTIERREVEMMKNIGNYCRQTSFSAGAFLVGAAHRQSIMDKSRKPEGGDSSAIQWDFARFLEEPNAREERESDI